MPSDSALSDKIRSVIYTQTRHKARSSPAVGLPRALWKHFASASFSAPVADFRGGVVKPLTARQLQPLGAIVRAVSGMGKQQLMNILTTTKTLQRHTLTVAYIF